MKNGNTYDSVFHEGGMFVSESKKQTTAKLWTRDFTIITAGSVISMMGNIISGFAIGLLVLDYTGSTLYYALYMFLYTFPRIVAPIVAGPYLDKFSRKRIIYSLDFISAGIYGLMGAAILMGWFSFPLLAVGTFLVGGIDSIYRVAYDSFYPMLISEGNYQKAYSIASILETVISFVVPLSAFLYNLIGLGPLLVANAVTFLTAAIMETQIKQKEEYSEARKNEVYGMKKYLSDFKEGMSYLNRERGLMAITAYFTVSSVFGGVISVLQLPYFKGNYANGEYIYILVGFGAMIGRFIGGSIYYKFQMPTKRKYSIAFCVYLCTSLIDGILLFTPLRVMGVLLFISGIMGVTSYNIRISATQSYVPDERKGRFNGTFEMLNTTGMMIGEVIAGGLSAFMGERYIILMFGVISAIAAIVIIGGNKEKVSYIYNREA